MQPKRTSGILQHLFLISLVSLWLGVGSALRYSGADFSFLLLLESTTNIEYTRSSSVKYQPFEQIVSDSGVNLARIRIWTAGIYDLNYGLKLAKRASVVGMDIMVDLHYDDTWADPGHQAIPKGWPTNLERLASKVHNYTCAVMEAFNAQGTPIQFVQIGNEINDGILWPTGRISVNGFVAASKLLHAGASAVHKAFSTTKNVIHLANGWKKDEVIYFFSGIFSVGDATHGRGGFLKHSNVNVMGFSTTASLENLRSSMDYVLSTYKKEIMIVETDWPAECDMEATPLSEPAIPVSVEGQEIWTDDIVRILNELNAEDHNALELYTGNPAG